MQYVSIRKWDRRRIRSSLENSYDTIRINSFCKLQFISTYQSTNIAWWYERKSKHLPASCEDLQLLPYQADGTVFKLDKYQTSIAVLKSSKTAAHRNITQVFNDYISQALLTSLKTIKDSHMANTTHDFEAFSNESHIASITR